MKAVEMEVEVMDIRKITGDGHLKAFADVRLGGCLIIKGFSVVMGRKGVFVSMPRKVSKDGRWFDVLEPDTDLKEAIESKVLGSYQLEVDGVSS